MTGLHSKQSRARRPKADLDKQLTHSRVQRKPGWDATIHNLNHMKLTPRQLAEKHAAAVSKNKLPSSVHARHALQRTGTDNTGECSSEADDAHAHNDDPRLNFKAVADALLRKKAASSSSGQASPSGRPPAARAAQSDMKRVQPDASQQTATTAVKTSRPTADQPARQQQCGHDAAAPDGHAFAPSSSPTAAQQELASTAENAEQEQPAPAVKQCASTGAASLLDGADCLAEQADTSAIWQQHGQLEHKLERLTSNLAAVKGGGLQAAQVSREVAQLQREQQAIKAELQDFMAHTSSLLTTLQQQISHLLAPTRPSSLPEHHQQQALHACPSSQADRAGRPHRLQQSQASSLPGGAASLPSHRLQAWEADSADQPAHACRPSSMLWSQSANPETDQATNSMPESTLAPPGQRVQGAVKDTGKPGAEAGGYSSRQPAAQPLHERNALASWPSQWPKPLAHKPARLAEFEEEATLHSYSESAARENFGENAPPVHHSGFGPGMRFQPITRIIVEEGAESPGSEGRFPQPRTLPRFLAPPDGKMGSQDLASWDGKRGSLRARSQGGWLPGSSSQATGQLKPLQGQPSASHPISGMDAGSTLSLHAWAAAGGGQGRGKHDYMR